MMILKNNDKLSNKTIKKIVEEHAFRTEEENGKIYGFIPWTNAYEGTHGEEKTDLTGMTLKELKFWLGY